MKRILPDVRMTVVVVIELLNALAPRSIGIGSFTLFWFLHWVKKELRSGAKRVTLWDTYLFEFGRRLFSFDALFE